MAYAVEDENHLLMACPAYQAVRADFQELYDDCGGDMTWTLKIVGFL
jgi:hypothetical protein